MEPEQGRLPLRRFPVRRPRSRSCAIWPRGRAAIHRHVHAAVSSRPAPRPARPPWTTAVTAADLVLPASSWSTPCAGRQGTTPSSVYRGNCYFNNAALSPHTRPVRRRARWRWWTSTSTTATASAGHFLPPGRRAGGRSRYLGTRTTPTRTSRALKTSTGSAGLGFNRNYPLPEGVGDACIEAAGVSPAGGPRLPASESAGGFAGRGRDAGRPDRLLRPDDARHAPHLPGGKPRSGRRDLGRVAGGLLPARPRPRPPGHAVRPPPAPWLGSERR